MDLYVFDVGMYWFILYAAIGLAIVKIVFWSFVFWWASSIVFGLCKEMRRAWRRWIA